MNNHTDKKANTIKLYFIAYKNNLEANYVTSPVNFSTNLEDLRYYFNDEDKVILEIEAKVVDTANLTPKPGNQ